MFHMLDDDVAVMETERCYGRHGKRHNAVENADNMTDKCVTLTVRRLQTTADSTQ